MNNPRIGKSETERQALEEMAAAAVAYRGPVNARRVRAHETKASYEPPVRRLISDNATVEKGF